MTKDDGQRDDKGCFVEGNDVGAQFAEGNLGGPGGPVGNTKRETHGVYSYQEHGELPEARKTSALVSRVDQIRDHLRTRDGLELEQEQVTERALVALDLALSWVQKQREQGKPLADIRVYKMVPALLNTAGRQIRQLFDIKGELGKNADVLDYEELVKQLERQAKDG